MSQAALQKLNPTNFKIILARSWLHIAGAISNQDVVMTSIACEAVIQRCFKKAGC